jgi:hypothetical protein
MIKTGIQEKLISSQDDKGNTIYSKNNGKRIIIYLKVAKWNVPKKIGVVSLAKRQLTIRRVKEKHLFKKYNAYGLNVYILRNAKTFDSIKIMDNYNTYIISREWAVMSIKYLTFAKQGFELQGFLSLNQLEPFKI